MQNGRKKWRYKTPIILVALKSSLRYTLWLFLWMGTHVDGQMIKAKIRFSHGQIFQRNLPTWFCGCVWILARRLIGKRVRKDMGEKIRGKTLKTEGGSNRVRQKKERHVPWTGYMIFINKLLFEFVIALRRQTVLCRFNTPKMDNCHRFDAYFIFLHNHIHVYSVL